MAAMCLGGGCTTQVPASHARMQSLYPAERVRAIRAAASSADPAALPSLIDRLDDEDAVVRFAAINALRRMTGTRLEYLAGADERTRGLAVARWRRFMTHNATDHSPAESGNANARP